MESPRLQDDQSTVSTMEELSSTPDVMSSSRKGLEEDWNVKEGTSSERKIFSFSTFCGCFKNPMGRLCCGMLVLHFVLLLIFTGAVLMAVRWNDIISVNDGDVLINNRDGNPLRVQQLIQSAQANMLAEPQLASVIRVVSVVVTLPKDHASNNNVKEEEAHDVIHRMYNVEGVEIRGGTNTTVLWLSMGHMMTITPQRVTLQDRRSNSLIYEWEASEGSHTDEVAFVSQRSSLASKNFLGGQGMTERNATTEKTVDDRKLQYVPPPVMAPTPFPYVNYYPYTYPYPYYPAPYPYPVPYPYPYPYPYYGSKKKHGRW